MCEVRIEDLSPFERFQLEKYGNVVRSPAINPNGSSDLENGSEEMRRFAEWNHQQEQQQLLEYERD